MTMCPTTWCKLFMTRWFIGYRWRSEPTYFLFDREQMNDMEKHLELYKNEYPLKNYKE